MSAPDHTITINPTKPSELDFEVKIQGMDDDAPPIVRFVLMDMTSNHDHSFRCEKSSEDKHRWTVNLPAIDWVKAELLPFRVEVIADGYYFEPAQGNIGFIKQPDISIGNKKTAKPTVTTSFNVKQSEVSEASGGGDVVGQQQITNRLLTPEFEPRSTTIHPPEDEQIDHDKLQPVAITDIASGITPGQGTDDTGLAGEFDAKLTAAAILAKTIGKVTKPNTQGTLFDRKGGKATIPGLQDPAERLEKEQRSSRVKQVLDSLK